MIEKYFKYILKKEDDTMFRLATEVEAEKLNEIIIQAAKRIRKAGSKQWAGMLDGSAINEVREKINKREAYVWEVNNEIAGMLYASPIPSNWDKDMWGDKIMNPAYYIHRVAVPDGFQGKQIPHNMLRDLQKKNSNSVLRLDCVAHKEVLNRLYTEVGFVLVGVKEDYGRDGDQVVDFNLYEYHNETSL